ncbi:MAG: rod shape-determining protein RodA [Bacteroidales bacterium]|nr:rod shape-determining protein RodA [Bacteroidales bacterium]
MTGNASIYSKLDWRLIIYYLILVVFGWLNIFSSVHAEDSMLFDFSQRYGMHFIWMCISIALAVAIVFVIPSKIYNGLAWWMYILMIGLLLVTLVIGVEVKGSRSWISLGGLQFQPAEFSKITTALALSALMGKYGYVFKRTDCWIKALATIGLPMLLILMEKETGSMLVYIGFFLVFYREGMSGWFLLAGLFAVLEFILGLVFSPFVAMLVLTGTFLLIYFIRNRNVLPGIIITAVVITLLAFMPKLLAVESIAAKNPFPAEIWIAIVCCAASVFVLVRGLLLRTKDKFMRNLLIFYILFTGFIFSVQFIFNNVLQDHQRARIEVLLGMKDDPKGVGYNVHQSLIAIGSGGLFGKGYMQGTQTRFDFVPEQTTDFIFCTIGEEWGFVGSMAVLVLYFLLLMRIINKAEQNADNFTRIYGYCVACCLLMHILINICMTIGLMPVIGIPLPFLSYGGSSLLAFTILLFIFIRLDLDQWRYLKH